MKLSVGVDQLEAPYPEEWFPVSPAIEPSLTVGYALGGGHSFELSASYLRSETKQEDGWTEAPYIYSFRAFPIEASYQYRLPCQIRGLQPLAGLSTIKIRVKDTWKSDTPTESMSASVLGWRVSFGVIAKLFGTTSMVSRWGYRYTKDANERYFRAIGLSGLFIDVGIQVTI